VFRTGIAVKNLKFFRICFLRALDLPLGEFWFGFVAGVVLRFLSTELQLVGSRFTQGNFFAFPV
jgi:hypothetical protein